MGDGKGGHVGPPQRRPIQRRPPHQDPIQRDQIQRDQIQQTPISEVVQWFKTMTTNHYIRGVKQNGWKPFAGKLWLRNYWEHIIRNDYEYARIPQYIINNTQKWSDDHLK